MPASPSLPSPSFAVILAVLQLKFGSTLLPNTLIPGLYNGTYGYAAPILLLLQPLLLMPSLHMVAQSLLLILDL